MNGPDSVTPLAGSRIWIAGVPVAPGLVISGSSQNGRLAEIIELSDHPFFVAGQFHPELRSRPTRPHPLFRGFVGAAAEFRRARTIERPIAVIG